MVNDESSNWSDQKFNDVKGDLVGRDKITTNITLFINVNLPNYQDNIVFLLENEGYILSEKFQNPIIQAALSKMKKEYESILQDNKLMPKNKFSQKKSEEIVAPLERQEFGKAHRILAAAINDPADEHFNLLFKQYLITGFIYYCQENDMEGLRGLLHKGSSFSITDDPEIDLIIGNIFQEICTRDTNLDALEGYMPILENLYASASIAVKPAMANSLGLAYRRLGERTGIALLKKAILIFDEGLAFNTDNLIIEVDLKDQKAITYVRIFEFNKEKSNLITAQELLTECVDLFEHLTDYRGNRLKPRIFNNLGNVYKQKALFLETEKTKNADKAIDCYCQAENYWTEASAKYEWALLQKNKAEAKYAKAKVNHSRELLIDALKDCLSSIKYRDLDNSPYQWGKSVEICFQIVLMLRELESLAIIPKSMQENIVFYTEQIDMDNSKWVPKNFTDFLTNAKQTQKLLRN